jgi:hypothetical protein
VQITRTRSKYYLLSLLGALMVAVGVLAVAPSTAQAQLEASADKECTPNPVQIGEQLICTVEVVPPIPDQVALIFFEDTFPVGITPTSATLTAVAGECEVVSNTVICEGATTGAAPLFRVTIDATAQQCGTFQNTASAAVTNLIVRHATATEEITVEGCEEPLPPAAPGQQPGGGGAAPITQEGEQESESGEIEQTFDVS